MDLYAICIAHCTTLHLKGSLCNKHCTLYNFTLKGSLCNMHCTLYNFTLKGSLCNMQCTLYNFTRNLYAICIAHCTMYNCSFCSVRTMNSCYARTIGPNSDILRLFKRNLQKNFPVKTRTRSFHGRPEFHSWELFMSLVNVCKLGGQLVGIRPLTHLPSVCV